MQVRVQKEENNKNRRRDISNKSDLTSCIICNSLSKKKINGSKYQPLDKREGLILRFSILRSSYS